MVNTRERFKLIFQHKEADRVPMLADPWKTTVERWQREGMPEYVSSRSEVLEYFGLDNVISLKIDISPRCEEKVIEDTDEYIIQSTSWGGVKKDWKHKTSTPHFTERTIVDRDSWEDAKSRMVMGRDRIDWETLRQNYSKWREKGWWVHVDLFFGFDVTHSKIVGTERMLIMMVEDPELVIDIFNTQLNCNLQLLDMILDEGYEFDSIHWCDDMGYRNGTFFSVDMYRNLLKPVHKKAVDWAHSKGIVAQLHSCGNINEFLPELIDIGLDALNPLEVKAGMDPIHLKKTYGDNLVLNGGLNSMLWDNIDGIEAEIKRLLPVLKKGGGYIFKEDHSIPDSVSLKNFRRIVEVAKKLGKY